MNNTFELSSNYPAWAIVDSSVILANLRSLERFSGLLDINIPLLNICWNNLYEDFFKLGITGAFSNNAKDLESIKNAEYRIMSFGHGVNQLGYAIKEVTPIINSISDCHTLSNIAQEHNMRVKYVVSIETVESEFMGGHYGLASILEQASFLPMIDLIGVYFPDSTDNKYFREMALNHVKPYISEKPICIGHYDFPIKNTKNLPIAGWELLGVNHKDTKTCAVTIGAWAYPMSSLSNNVKANIKLGSCDIDKNTPILISGSNCTIESVALYSSIVSSPNAFSSPSPWQCVICGGSDNSSISPHQWEEHKLKSIIRNWKYPIYLKIENKYLEFLPNNSCSIFQQSF